MRLPKLTKTQKKIAIGAGAGVGLATVLWLALKPKKTTAPSGGMVTAAKNLVAQATVPKSRVVQKGQRVIAWPKESDKNNLAYIKFVNESGVNGGWIDEMTVLRDSETSGTVAQALAGLGAGGISQPQSQPQQVVPSGAATPNAVMLKTQFMYTSPDDPKKIAAAQDFLLKLFQGKFVLMAEDDFRFWAERDGVARAIALIGYIWGSDFSPDKIKDGLSHLASQSTCQSIAAAVTGEGADWEDYKLHSCYNISAQDHPEQWWQCFIDTWNKHVDAMLAKGSVSGQLSNLNLGGNTAMPPPQTPGAMYAMEASDDQIKTLAAFATGFIAYTQKEKPGSPVKMPPPPDPALGPIGENMYKTTLATIGMAMAKNFIQVLSLREGETLDGTKDGPKNPCIREMNFDLVFAMFANTIGVVLSLATAGVTTALGAAFQIAKAIEAIVKLSELSK
jgi:hypothetical protein